MKSVRKLLVMLAIGGATCVASFAQEPSSDADKRLATHADIWLMRRLGRPAISPDGRWVVVPVEEPAYNPQSVHRDLWLISVEGSFSPRKITAARADLAGVDWSPNSQKIAFSSQREGDERPQLYVLNLSAGGEAERLTSLPGGARAPHWSPDGSKLLFTSDVIAETHDALAAAKPADVRLFERYPARSGDRWFESRRPRLFVQDAIAGAASKDLLANTPFANSAVWRGVLTDAGEDFPATWTPDGTGIVFAGCVNADALVYSKANTELFFVAAQGGEATRLTQTGDAYGRPAFTADGKALIVRVLPQPAEGSYHLPKLLRYAWPWAAVDPVNLSGGFEREAGDPFVSPDGARVFFLAEEGGAQKLYGVAAAGGAVNLEGAATLGTIDELSPSSAHEASSLKFVCIGDAAGVPPEVFVLENAAGKWTPRRISEFNTARGAPLDLPRPEAVWFKSSGGVDVQSWLYRPASFDSARKYPVILYVHDGPHAAASDSFRVDNNPYLLASNKYVVLETNYRGSVGFGEKFAQAIARDPVKGPADDVGAALDDVLQRFPFTDTNRVAAVGQGYGGLLVNWLQATTTRFRCFVVQAGAVDPQALWSTGDRSFNREMLFGGPTWEPNALWAQQSPVAFANNHAAGTGWLTPTLLACGENDFRVPVSNTLESWTYLQRLKVPSRLIVFPGEGHTLERGEDSRYLMREMQAWFTQWFEAAK